MVQLIQKKWLTLPQAARYCGVAYDTFKKWLRDNEGLRKIAYKPGDRLMFSEEELDAWWHTQSLGARSGDPDVT
jgi:excisionase family DNA binding protein